MKKYYITGMAGSGKSTIARMLTQNNISAIDIDDHDLSRWVNKETGEVVQRQPGVDKDFFKNNASALDIERLFRMIEEREGSVFVVGLADNQKDFMNKFDKVFLLRCDPSVLIQRINSRNDNSFGKDEEARNMILRGYEKFENRMMDLGAIPIDTSMSIYKVYEELMSQTND
ncbi:MAG: AAA family ATPase [Candidatus Pacebacteria bacterium]|nr:AAA family ATPase [Candidatus Paceibacterota bacterium]MBP9715736.1 AAA family ATPase [Candidatus Paceibacterota bacterium]